MGRHRSVLVIRTDDGGGLRARPYMGLAEARCDLVGSLLMNIEGSGRLVRSRRAPARRLGSGRVGSSSLWYVGLMRLITWNCKGAFTRKQAVFSSLEPDVLVVPEAERFDVLGNVIGRPPVRSQEWVGENPKKGLAVVSYGDYSLRTTRLMSLDIDGSCRFRSTVLARSCYLRSGPSLIKRPATT